MSEEPGIARTGAGSTFVGRWTVPLLVDGVPTAIAGGLYHAPDPSPIWFWPIIVVAACVLAATRMLRGGGGWFVLFLIAAAAIWEGATLVGALLYGFVFALAERSQRPRRARQVSDAAIES